MDDIIQIANNVFEIESNAINNLANNLTKDFVFAIKTILESNGKLIISGMGKSGIIGKKIAATLASTGTPSFFLHPGEAYHGDLGMIQHNDIVLLISNSGETDEVLKLIPFLKSQKNIIIAMSGNSSSTLAKNANYHLNIKVNKEACPLQLAPTASTTATLVMGDALAVALMKKRNFKEQDFAKFHPGGSLGKKLLMTVSDIMRTENLPILNENSSTIDVVHTISGGRSGLCVILTDTKEILGILTDGDLRRLMDTYKEDFFKLELKQVVNKKPITITKDTKLIDAYTQMSNSKISSLLVIENNSLLGIVQIYDMEI
jgi:arabinose-5-phosphate isomerase